MMIQRAPAAIRRRLARRTPGGFAANVKWNDFRAKSCGADAAAAGKANHAIQPSSRPFARLRSLR
ncbi:hypothetical protein E0H72_14110 [Rhizobium leguminosarum bv. viciae]|nr:hypothetical protein E0H72_14110 [Rhizobium leguminosarum bv. viciae]